MHSLINIGIYITYIMVGFAALAAIGFGIKKIISNTENTKKTLYTIFGLIIVLLISYFTASEEILKSFEKYEISNSISKNVGMGLITFYILIFSAIVAVLYAEVSKLFSK